MDKLMKQYNESIPDVGKLKKKVRLKLRQYEESQKQAKKPTYEEQEDGWIKVNHKSGRDPTKKHVHNGKRKKRRKTEKLVNFYSFEVKEAKLKKHRELLEKFEDDKKRLAKMKAQRKFKV